MRISKILFGLKRMLEFDMKAKKCWFILLRKNLQFSFEEDNSVVNADPYMYIEDSSSDILKVAACNLE